MYRSPPQAAPAAAAAAAAVPPPPPAPEPAACSPLEDAEHWRSLAPGLHVCEERSGSEGAQPEGGEAEEHLFARRLPEFRDALRRDGFMQSAPVVGTVFQASVHNQSPSCLPQLLTLLRLLVGWVMGRWRGTRRARWRRAWRRCRYVASVSECECELSLGGRHYRTRCV